jgi:hypothetical protein
MPMRTPEEDQAAIAELSASLPTRPDAERVRRLLAEAFVAHIDDLWPNGEAQGSPEWISANVDLVLATIERLYAMAIEGHSGSGEFLGRMSWLPRLVIEIEAEGVPLDG